MLQKVQLGKGLMLPQVDLQRGPQGPGQGAREQPSSTRFPQKNLVLPGQHTHQCKGCSQRAGHMGVSQCVHTSSLCPMAGSTCPRMHKCIHTQACTHSTCAHTTSMHTGQLCTQRCSAHMHAMHMYIHAQVYVHRCTCTCTRPPPEYQAQAEMAVPAGDFWQQKLPNPSPMKFP